MIEYSERANELMIDLLATLGKMKNLPIIAKAISQPMRRDDLPITESKD